MVVAILPLDVGSGLRFTVPPIKVEQLLNNQGRDQPLVNHSTPK